METNKSIISRDVIAINDHKKVGKVKDVTVDCETKSVGDLIIENETTHSALALPFEKTVSIGDAFVVIESRDDLLSPNDTASKLAILDGYTPVGVDVYSLAGNRIGAVDGFEFDEVYGAVTRITMEDATEFADEAILFFSPEYVFVNDGRETAKMLREKARGTGRAESSSANAHQDLRAKHPEPKAAEPAAAKKSDQAELREALLGERLQEDVTSEDGKFSAKKNATIDEKMLDEAEAHDALVLLTMAIDF